MTDEQMPRLWGLGALAIALHWLEELVNTLSGPLLVLGLGIALVDLLTDGALTVHAPVLLYVWAISQAAGVDAQLVGSFARARHALRMGHRLPLIGLLVLGAILAYVGWIAAEVFATEQAQHITTAQALALLGMNPTTWIIQRTALSVFLVALSGWTRYHAPAKDKAARVESERARLQREIDLEPLRQQARAQKAVGAMHLVRQTLAAARGKEVSPSDAPSPRPPTGPGTPAVSGNGHHDDDGDYDTQMSLPAVRIVRPDQSSHSSQRNPQRMRGQGGPNDSQVSGRSSPRHSKSGRRGPQRRQVEPAGPRIVAAIESNPALVRSATQGPRVRATAQVASVAPSTVSRHSRSNPAVAAAAQRVAQ